MAVITKDIASKLPPTNIPCSPDVLLSASNKRDIVINARATNPYSAPKVIVDDKIKLGNALTYLVAGADVSAQFSMKLLFCFKLLIPFSVAQIFRLSSIKNCFGSTGNSFMLYISFLVFGE